MSEDKKLEDAKFELLWLSHIDILYGNTYCMTIGQLNKIQEAIDKVLETLENSIPKEIIREKINERQFELQQQDKDFKDDIRLNTLQEIYYLNESEK